MERLEKMLNESTEIERTGMITAITLKGYAVTKQNGIYTISQVNGAENETARLESLIRAYEQMSATNPNNSTIKEMIYGMSVVASILK